MKTSLEEERAAQARWRPRPGLDRQARIDRLLENEFAAPEALAAATDRDLRRVVAHAAAAVPYYRRLFRRYRLAPGDIAAASDLVRLPVLTKDALRRNRKALCAAELPKGEKVYGWFASSGTTGQPTLVLQTESSNLMYTYLVRRQYRWFRLDTALTLAGILPPHVLPRRRDGKPHGADAMGRIAGWRYLSNHFRTGPMIYASASLPAERLLDWLALRRPGYLMAYAETLEQLALACDGDWPVDSLRGAIAIGQQLTPAMRHRVETVTGMPVHQGYGLNEIGMVASRCAAGRYHVHAEHCHVEIVDEAGRPCPPGAIGHVVVTGLSNPAMPLLRYDTGDLAEAVAGPCPCGRTLPGFGEIQGRYSRTAYLPPGTSALFVGFRTRICLLPPATLAGLRQYQIHQFRDGSFELRLVTSGAPAPRLLDALNGAWRDSGGDRHPLRITPVASIPLPTGGKFLDFTSDFMPAADGVPVP